MIAPPSASPCPDMYFVSEYATKSTPCSSGRVTAGVANVLSTTTRAPASCASSARPRKSTSFSTGLHGVSAWINFVLGRNAACTSSRSDMSAIETSKPFASRNPRANSAVPA
jgi:hypothetical protein